MKKLNVLGLKVSVQIKKIDPMYGHLAHYDPNTNKITIDPSFSNLTKTYFHECGHPFFERSGLQQAVSNEPIEEMFCELLSSFLDENIVTMYQTYNKLKKIEKK